PDGDRQVDLYLRRLANAKLVIPQALTVKKEDKANEIYEPRHGFEPIEANFEKSYLLYKASLLEDVRTELSSLGKVYRKDYDAALKKAQAEHEETVENINKEYFEKFKIKGRNDVKNIPEGVFGELDSDQRLFLKYPEFKFEFIPPL